MPCRTRCVEGANSRKTCARAPVLLSRATCCDRGRTDRICGPAGAAILRMGPRWAGAGRLWWGARRRAWARWAAASYPNFPFECAAGRGRPDRRHSRLRRTAAARPARSAPAFKRSMLPTPPRRIWRPGALRRSCAARCLAGGAALCPVVRRAGMPRRATGPSVCGRRRARSPPPPRRPGGGVNSAAKLGRMASKPCYVSPPSLPRRGSKG